MCLYVTLLDDYHAETDLKVSIHVAILKSVKMLVSIIIYYVICKTALNILELVKDCSLEEIRKCKHGFLS